jgi:hypothetical protein
MTLSSCTRTQRDRQSKPYAYTMSMLAAAQITAVATAVLAAGAIITAIFAVRAFIKQADELTTLQSQAGDQGKTNARLREAAELQAQELKESLEERKREAAGRRSAQASRVFAWEERLLALGSGENLPADTSGVLIAHVRNASDQAIYDLEYRWLIADRPHPYNTSRINHPLGPGEEYKVEFRCPPDKGLDRFSVAVFFHDAFGIPWLRRPNGDLEEES